MVIKREGLGVRMMIAVLNGRSELLCYYLYSCYSKQIHDTGTRSDTKDKSKQRFKIVWFCEQELQVQITEIENSIFLHKS